MSCPVGAPSPGELRMIGRALCRQDPRATGHWRYVATSPMPSAPAQLWTTGTTASLQVSARLDVDDSDRRRIAEELGATRLDPAQITVEAVELILGGDREPDGTILGRSGSSGYPPYEAIFTVVLDAEMRARVDAALSGHGALTVTYRVVWPAPQRSSEVGWMRTTHADTTGSTTGEAAWATGSSSPLRPITASADIRSWFAGGGRGRKN